MDLSTDLYMYFIKLWNVIFIIITLNDDISKGFLPVLSVMILEMLLEVSLLLSNTQQLIPIYYLKLSSIYQLTSLSKRMLDMKTYNPGREFRITVKYSTASISP